MSFDLKSEIDKAARQQLDALDAARYRKLKAAISVPFAMQAFLKFMNWHPDTFEMGIDEAIDSAILAESKRVKEGK